VAEEEFMSRKSDRRHAFKLVFQIGFYEPFEPDENIGLYFSEVENTQGLDRAFIEQEVRGVLAHREGIDERIGAAASGWDVPRLSRVDLAIMRLAVFELCHTTEIPPKVAINEAVELAKMYSTDEAPAFINGILGKIAATAKVDA